MVERVYHRLRIALPSILRRGTVEQELDEELQFHLDQMQESAVSRGDDLSDARGRAAARDRVREHCQSAPGTRGDSHS